MMTSQQKLSPLWASVWRNLKLVDQSQETLVGPFLRNGLFDRRGGQAVSVSNYSTKPCFVCCEALPSSRSSGDTSHSRPSENQDHKHSTSVYYFENGLRKVYPYKYTFLANTKTPWLKRSIKSVFEEYFKVSEDLVVKKCENRFIRINGCPVDADYTFKGGDVLNHDIHFHEYAVLDRPIKIVDQDSDKLVIDKPCSLPVHQVGHYLRNTVLEILKTEHGFTQVLNVNRLDKVTSGVLVLATNPESAKRVSNHFEGIEIKKIYVARVEGKFPTGSTLISKRIKQISFATGYSEVDDLGRECVTKFRRLFYDEKSDFSVVLCTPLTGRTHQIRVHLAFMKHPIVNDVLYNPKPSKFEGKFFVPPHRGIRWEFDENCLSCVSPLPDPDPRGLELYLHAWSYEGPDWKYETDLPCWANLNWEAN